MVLSGSLSDFNLPEVFELIRLSRKTGVLRVRRTDADGSIWLREGEVFLATSDWRRALLGERLVAAGKVTDGALASALAIRESEPVGGRRIGTILVDEGYLSPQVLEAFVQEQIQDTIFDLMRWEEGTFFFEPLTEIPADEDIGVSVSALNIVVENSRRIAEWNRIRRRIPSVDAVYRMTAGTGQEVSLKPAEWRLLTALDGTRPVAELPGESGSTDFDVARSLYGLLTAGLLEASTPEQTAEARLQQQQRRARLTGPAEAEPPALDASVEPPVDAAPAAPEPCVPPVELAAEAAAVVAPDAPPPFAAILSGEKPAEAAAPEMMHLGVGDVLALGNELTALTGASRLRRPGVHVPAAAGAGATQPIRRDASIDRATVELVIAGFERL